MGHPTLGRPPPKNLVTRRGSMALFLHKREGGVALLLGVDISWDHKGGVASSLDIGSHGERRGGMGKLMPYEFR